MTKPTARKQDKNPAFQVDDRVVRNKAVGGKQEADMLGTVLRVTPVSHSSGGTRARVRVLWDNGFEGSVEDRQILLMKQPARGH